MERNFLVKDLSDDRESQHKYIKEEWSTSNASCVVLERHLRGIKNESASHEFGKERWCTSNASCVVLQCIKNESASHELCSSSINAGF